jgi:hypothetical protein
MNPLKDYLGEKEKVAISFGRGLQAGALGRSGGRMGVEIGKSLRGGALAVGGAAALAGAGMAAQKLYDAATKLSWRFAEGTGKTRTKLTFSGTSDIIIGPGQYLLLVKNRTKFSTAYSEPAGTIVYEWSCGKLNLSVDKMDLAKGISIDGIDIGWVRIDQVNYSDGSHPAGNDPWPKNANGKTQRSQVARIAIERLSAAAPAP